ncbi:DUF4350 domain-containing protein [Flavobacteriaceae bacterium M23B6Z8]
MSKAAKIYIGITVLLVGLLIFIEYTKPKQISWFPSYDRNHTIPLGTKVLHEQMKTIFKNDFKDVKMAPYVFLKEQGLTGTYFFVNGSISYGKEELNTLLEWVSAGNKLIVASSSLEEALLDTLRLKTDYVTNIQSLKASYELSLSNPAFKNRNVATFDRNTTVSYFTEEDSLNTVAIGHIKLKGEKATYPNVIKRSFGNGEIILSLFPQAFSNYFILKQPNQEYVSGLLSYIDPSKTVYYDNHYKSGAKFYSSPLYVFLNNKALKWAYYLVLIAALFYIIFEGRRKQRSIPVIEPLRNQTLDFVRTIANMYYEKNDHRDIATYKINHFLAWIRSQHSLQTFEFKKQQIESIALRNGKSVEETKALFDFIKALQYKLTISKKELIDLNQMIADFKK